jgi:hypothetical protein
MYIYIYMSMYPICSALIQKQVSKNILFFTVGIIFSELMFQIFTRISLLKSKNFQLSYLYKKLSYTNTLK